VVLWYLLCSGAGLALMNGFQYVSAHGNLFRTGTAVFTVLGGAMIFTGYTQFRAWITGSLHIAGNTFFVGQGLLYKFGGSTSSSTVSQVSPPLKACLAGIIHREL